MNSKNIIIIAVVGIIVVVAAFFLVPKNNKPVQSLNNKQVSTEASRMPSVWIQAAQKRIASGQAQAVLTEIEPKITQFTDPGMQFHLNELKGDALLQLGKCPEADAAFKQATDALASAQSKFVPEFGEITQEERAKFGAELQAKSGKAKACTK